MSIHLNIEDLLSARTIETERIEFKKGWGIDNIQSTESEQAESISNLDLNIDIQMDTSIASIDRTTMSAIVSVIDEKERGLLTLALQAHNRPTLLASIGVSNHQKNYNNYMLPLAKKGWLSMTIPDKPTSPNQKYITTTKGRLLLKILETK